MANQKKQTFAESARANWDGFLKFLYDGEKGTVLGRDANSWTKILIFYLFYYGFLACLFAASVSIVRNTLDDYTPTYQTRLQTPGVGIQPKIPSDVEQTSNIMYTVPGAGGDSKNVPYTRLVEQIKKFLIPYNSSIQTPDKLYKNCVPSDPMEINQRFNGDEQAYSCAFSTEDLGPCGTYPYGYDVGQPCLYIKLNRIINWFPVGYTDLSDATATESKALPLANVLSAYNQPYRPYLMYTYCFSEENPGAMYQNDLTNNKYYPESMGLPFVFYPYHGKARQPTYLNPLVAVQLTNVTRGAKIHATCKVYAKNIVDNKDMGEGFFSFDMQLDNK